MRKALLLLGISVLCAATAPARAETPAAPNQQRDECLLASSKCAGQADTITEKIAKLQREIDKGTAVYTPEELAKLKVKLHEAVEVYETLQDPS